VLEVLLNASVILTLLVEVPSRLLIGTRLAGAGVKPGVSYGRTDEFGFKAVEDVATPHDFHATILHLLGLDHERLTYYHNRIERRLTNVHGHVIRDILT
jgi:hypothetical protein